MATQTGSLDLRAVKQGITDLAGSTAEATEGLAGEVSTVQGDLATLQGVVATQGGDISSLQTATDANASSINAHTSAITSIQNGQTTINNNISVLRTTTQNLDDRTTSLERAVVIDPDEPSVSVISGDGSVKVTSARVVIKGGGNSVAWGDAESFNAQKGVFTEIRPRTISMSGSTATLSGNLVFIARSNGHVSLKKMS